MPKNVKLLYEARMELRNIAAYRRQKVGINSARNITNAILDGLERLKIFPEMGFVPPIKSVAEAGFRVLVIKEYLCFYRIEEDSILIYHIVHGSTDYIRHLF